MAAVMIQAASFVEEKEVHLEEIITRLKAENQVNWNFELRKFFDLFRKLLRFCLL